MRKSFKAIFAILLVFGISGCGNSSSTTVDPTDSSVNSPVESSPTPTSYKSVSNRQWLIINRNMYDHVNEGFDIFGEIWQFDQATGSNAFLAYCAGEDSGHVSIATGEDCYVENTSDKDLFGELVEGDTFRARVIVRGEFTWTSAGGANMNAIKLEVVNISYVRHD